MSIHSETLYFLNFNPYTLKILKIAIRDNLGTCQYNQIIESASLPRVVRPLFAWTLSQAKPPDPF